MFKRIKKYHEENAETQDAVKTSFESLKKLKIAYIPYKRSLKGKFQAELSRFPYNELLKEGFFAGVGWAFGVTVGFVIISSLLVIILNFLGGLPLIGSWVANLVEETQLQLLKRNPIIR